jgi:hypothetical protein
MEAFKGSVRLQTSRSLRDWVNAALIPIDPNIFTYLSHDPVISGNQFTPHLTSTLQHFNLPALQKASAMAGRHLNTTFLFRNQRIGFALYGFEVDYISSRRSQVNGCAV